MAIPRVAVAAFFGGVAITAGCIGYCSRSPRAEKIKGIVLGVLSATLIGAAVIGLTALLGPRISSQFASSSSSWQTALKAKGAWIGL